jgi:1,4-dihydroxy-2-naphthoate octaprenyltransferase
MSTHGDTATRGAPAGSRADSTWAIEDPHAHTHADPTHADVTASVAPRRPDRAWRVWWQAIRPRTLIASLVPVAVGSALAIDRGAFALTVAVACASAALLLQIAANLANDAFDALYAVDREPRAGPTRITQAGWRTPRQVLSATALAMGLALVPGVYLVARGGLPIVAIGVASLAGAVGYSAGPVRLASLGLGEIASFVFFGLVAVCGTAYLHTGTLGAAELLAAVPIGLLTAAIMLVNNLRDRDSDARSGKRTLIVALGDRRGRALYTATLAAAFACLVPLAWLIGSAWVCAAFAASPLAWGLLQRVRAGCSGAALNPVLARTAQLDGLFGLLLAAGIAL